jgi:hypothetical protein
MFLDTWYILRQEKLLKERTYNYLMKCMFSDR